MNETKTSKPRGFAAMDPERRRELSRRGGITAHEKGTAHKFTSAEATAAGKLGGAARAKGYPAEKAAE